MNFGDELGMPGKLSSPESSRLPQNDERNAIPRGRLAIGASGPFVVFYDAVVSRKHIIRNPQQSVERG
jgi:hypothetical protein